jgi:amidase
LSARLADVDLHELTAVELAAAVRRREVSPVEVAEHASRRAARLDDSLGLFVTRTPELAAEQARAQERRVMTEDADDLPPLIGVPCPIKDMEMVAGVRHTMGSAALRDNIAEVDDGIVGRLREAGTLMLGKTNTPELGLPCYTESEVAPPARTPWDPTRSAGGSSGGAAAVVAAGVAPLAQGSDGGGSIRIPASATGLVGLKPSAGRVSPGPYGIDLGLAVLGGLSRDVQSTALLLDVLSRGWPGDTRRLPPARTTFAAAADRAVPAVRVGLLLDPVIDADAPVHPACRRAAEETARVLESLGHHVEPATVPFPAERWDAFTALWSAGAAAVPLPPGSEDLLLPLTRWLRSTGRGVSGVDVLQAQAVAQLVAREAAQAWDGLDVVLSPTLAGLPAPVGSLRDDEDPAAEFRAQTRFTPWTSVWNLIGAPAVSLPTSWHTPENPNGAAELPVGAMLGARLGEEELLLGLARQLQDAVGWHHRRPPDDGLPLGAERDTGRGGRGRHGEREA